MGLRPRPSRRSHRVAPRCDRTLHSCRSVRLMVPPNVSRERTYPRPSASGSRFAIVGRPIVKLLFTPRVGCNSSTRSRPFVATIDPPRGDSERRPKEPSVDFQSSPDRVRSPWSFRICPIERSSSDLFASSIESTRTPYGSLRFGMVPRFPMSPWTPERASVTRLLGRPLRVD
jgi:hypothetical protein